MGRIKTFAKMFLISALVATSFLYGCSTNNSDQADGDVTSTYSLAGGDDYFIPPQLSERTDWNIDIYYLKYDEKGVWIRICDNDNQGFYYNPIYFVLEYYHDGSWEKVSGLNEICENQDYVMVLPSDSVDYVDTNNLCRFSLMHIDDLQPGKYRLTKILSGKPFVCEFQID